MRALKTMVVTLLITGGFCYVLSDHRSRAYIDWLWQPATPPPLRTPDSSPWDHNYVPATNTQQWQPPPWPNRNKPIHSPGWSEPVSNPQPPAQPPGSLY